uniref:Endonuclease n=1 Tax=Pithovirus LCPAC304 TaxID=2506594 RepID=A0A481Z7X3_9VIRU|nr:MAG: endonuclease [Pithovirus LCPAC304]
MIYVRDKRCHCGKKRPSFNLKGKPAKYCMECKTTEMICVRDKLCHCGKKRPSFNSKGNPAKYCSACKTDKMINVVNKRCHCGKSQPFFNLKGEPAKYCSACKTNEMVNVRAKKCFCGKRQPAYNLKGKPAEHCAKCKTTEMIDVVHRRCISCGLYVSQKRYGWLCFVCFCWKFPESKPGRRHLTKERAVNTLMREAFPELPFSYNKSIGGCSQRKPDWFIDCYTHCIVVECDENQHKAYEELCEYARLMELIVDIAHRPLVVLRFNPDKYKDAKGKTIPGCFPGRTTKPNEQLRERFESLKSSINYHLNHVSTKMLTEEKFFYDEI